MRGRHLVHVADQVYNKFLVKRAISAWKVGRDRIRVGAAVIFSVEHEFNPKSP